MIYFLVTMCEKDVSLSTWRPIAIIFLILFLTSLFVNVEVGKAGNCTCVDNMSLKTELGVINHTITIKIGNIETPEQNKTIPELRNGPGKQSTTSKAKDLFLKGLKYSESRDYTNAIQAYRDALNFSDNTHGEVWYNLGNAYFESEKFLKSRDSYINSRIETLPEDYKSKAWFNLGNSYYMLGGKVNYENAIKSYDNAIEINTNYSNAYNNRALVRIEQEKYVQAVEDLEESINKSRMIEENNTNSDIQEMRAWNNKGLALRGMERYDEAFSALQNATRIKENPYSYLYKGLIVADLNQQLEESLSLLNKSLNISNRSLSDRDKFIVYNSMGNIYLKFGRYSDAVSAFINATNLSHEQGPSWNNGSAFIGKGIALMNIKDRKLDALDSFNRAIEQDPKNTEAYYGKGDVLYELGSYDEAMKAYREGMNIIIGENPDENQISRLFKSELNFLVVVLILMILAYGPASLQRSESTNTNVSREQDKYSIVLNKTITFIFSKERMNRLFFPCSLMLQLVAFLWILALYFPQKVVNYYVVGAVSIIAATLILLFLYKPQKEGLWSKLDLSLNEFSITRIGSLWMKALPLLPALIGLLPILMLVTFNIIPGDQARFFLIRELALLIFLGGCIFLPPLINILISSSTDGELRKTVLSIHFLWLGLTFLYLSRLFWCSGYTELNYPRDIGLMIIPEKTPIMLISFLIIFLTIFLIPYICGWRWTKNEREKFLSKEMQDLKDISTILQLKGEQRNRKINAIIGNFNKKIEFFKNMDIYKLIFEDNCDQEDTRIKCFSRKLIFGKRCGKKSDNCIRAMGIDFRFKSLDFMTEIRDELIKMDAPKSNTSWQPEFQSISLIESADHMSDDIYLLAKDYIEKIQEELSLLKESKPQLWIAAVSILSPVMVQILGSAMIKMGLSSQPESLLSGLFKILTGTGGFT